MTQHNCRVERDRHQQTSESKAKEEQLSDSETDESCVSTPRIHRRKFGRAARATPHPEPPLAPTIPPSNTNNEVDHNRQIRTVQVNKFCPFLTITCLVVHILTTDTRLTLVEYIFSTEPDDLFRTIATISSSDFQYLGYQVQNYGSFT